MTAYENIFTIKSTLEQINSSPDYSEGYKARKTAELTAQIKTLENQTLSQINRDWKGIKERAKTINQARAAAIEKEASQWDPARLNYAAERVKATLSEAQSIQDINRAWKAAQTGDRHYLKAFTELAPAQIINKYGMDAGIIASAIKSKAAELSTPPEFSELDQMTAALIKDAQALDDLTGRVQRELTRGGSIHDKFEVENKVNAAREGCYLNKRIVPDKGINTTLEFSDD